MTNEATVDFLFRDALARFPERVLLRVARGAAILGHTYRDVSVAICERVDVLRAAGLQPGDVALACEEDVLVSVLLAIACAHAGVVLLPVPPNITAEQFQAIRLRVNAKAILADPMTASSVRASGHEPLVFDDVVLASYTDEQVRHAARALQHVGRQHDAGDVFQLAQSSGTTGKPKIVVRTHTPIVRGAHALAFHECAGSAERILLILRTTRALGSFVLAAALARAAELAIPAQSAVASPAGVLEPTREDLERLAPTYLAIMPQTLRSLDRQRRLADPASPLVPESVRVVYLGPVSHLTREAHLLEELQRASIDVRSGYGTSEISPFCLMTRRMAWSVDHACGTPLPDVEWRLEDDELCVRSPGLMRGYFDAPARPESVFDTDGFFRTGDCFEVRPGGEFVYLGRKADAVRTQDGTLVHLTHLEELIEWGIDDVAQVLLVAAGRPGVVALLAVDADEGEAHAADGFLDESLHASRYDEMRRRIAEVVGSDLVRGVALFNRRFPQAAYRSLPLDYKTYRDRATLERVYAGRIEALYASTSSRHDDPTSS
ncbi:MAG: class I adenylate-forming enzyme family protein [Polyangia bacterium]